MRPGRDIASEAAARLSRAKALLHGHLEALAGLAAVALRFIESAVPRASVDPARPLIGVAALERAVRDHTRVSWALRLIWALRAKLMGDLARVERGEGVDEVLAAEARPAVAARNDADADDDDTDLRAELGAERGESGRETERENFGPYLSRRSGEAEFAEILKRPTHEVIALIREALRVVASPPDDPAGFEQRTAWPGLVPRAVAPPPAPSGLGLRSPCQG